MAVLVEGMTKARSRKGGTFVRAGQTAPLDEVERVREGWQDTLTRLEELVDED